MDKRTKEIIKHVGYPVYKVYVQMMNAYYLRHGMKTADKQFFKTFGRHIDWDDPKDLNEKINWLKFHEDMRMWARLADKYAVRSYVAKRGLEDILIPIYGHWTTARDVVDAWDSLPERFVLKSNNGSGHVLVVAGEKEKRAINRRDLYKQTRKWLRERDTIILKTVFLRRNCWRIRPFPPYPNCPLIIKSIAAMENHISAMWHMEETPLRIAGKEIYMIWNGMHTLNI